MGTPEESQSALDPDLALWLETGDRDARNRVVEQHRWIAVHVARRFARRGESLDDLIQVASIGVLKAVERFDPAAGASLASFGIATAIGELRRYFRDATWSVRVPRRLKELHVELGTGVEQLTHQLGRSPSISELAEHLDVSEEDVLEAMEAGAGYRSSPLATGAERGEGRTVEESPLVATDDALLDGLPDRLAIEGLLAGLSPRERRIVQMRFYQGLTQSEIAEVVGVSQVHVSRLLRASLVRMRAELGRAESDTMVDDSGLPADSELTT